MTRLGRPLKYETPLRRLVLRLPAHELDAVDAEPGRVRNDKIRELLAEALIRRGRRAPDPT